MAGETPITEERPALINSIIAGERVEETPPEEVIDPVVLPVNPEEPANEPEGLLSSWGDAEEDEPEPEAPADPTTTDTWWEVAKEHGIEGTAQDFIATHNELQERVKELEAKNAELETIAFADVAITNLRNAYNRTNEELVEDSIRLELTDGENRELTDEEQEELDGRMDDLRSRYMIASEGRSIKRQIQSEINRRLQEAQQGREKAKNGQSPINKDKLKEGIQKYLATQEQMYGLPLTTKGETEKKKLIDSVSGYAVNEFLDAILKDPQRLAEVAFYDKFKSRIKQTADTSVRNKALREILVDKNGQLSQGKPKGEFNAPPRQDGEDGLKSAVNRIVAGQRT